MREAGVLCFVALLVSVAEARPSALESVTGVISAENTEVIASSKYAERASSTGYAEVEVSTEYAEAAVSTQQAEVTTFVYYTEESTPTGYSEEATSTECTEEATSTQHADVVTSVQYTEVTTEDIRDVVTTKDFVVENTSVDITADVTSATENIKEISSTDNIEDTNNEPVKDSKEIATEFIDEEYTKRNVNLGIISTRNANVTAAEKIESEVNDVESTLQAVDHARFDKDVEKTNTTRYAALETTTTYTEVFGGFEGSFTERPVAVNNITEDVTDITDNIGSVRLKKHDPEPYVNSSMVLPCFAVNARRGITPFIARSYDFEAELESWTKKKLPTEIAFLNSDNSLHFVDLTERHQSTDNGLKVKEYGDKVSLYLYTRHGTGTGEKLSLDIRQILKAGFNPSHPTKVIAHGFWSNTNSTTVQLIKNAYLRFGYYNIIIVDWSPLVYGFYSSAREEAHGVGDYLGQFLRFLVYEGLTEPQKLHLIGHSLGAHLVGFAGKRAHQDGWGIIRITGLDPALPYFTMSNRTERLDRSDADVVDVIHTCANFLGMTSFLGDIDFYPNEGTNFQPGCNLDVFGICSHGRAVDYFAESISEPSGFVGKFCDFERADTIVKAENCPGEPFAIMGEWLEFSTSGRYILRTAARPPYGVGFDILYPAYLYKRMVHDNITVVANQSHFAEN